MYKNFANTVFIGKSINYLPSCHSTNLVAVEMIKARTARNGHIVITDDQFAGSGQVGRSWEAKPGKNLTFSIILYHDSLSVRKQFDLNMIVSLGIYDFLSNLLNIKVEIKWPNDIFIKNKKVGGILIRNSITGDQITDSVVGIGMNVNQTIFEAPQAISLKNLTGKEFQLQRLLPELVFSVEKRYLNNIKKSVNSLRVDYMDTLYRRGELHKFQIPATGVQFEGEIIGVDQSGRLSVNTGKRIEYFHFNTITFIP
ncbi:MAG: biotin--[acetyl-CoA-carboxylase] ligase [Cyclobacteriaceae bacterium]|nr:biotin--[acetyl-CoA-carboxylase] ligase [Cyclobacteriaceae bacterium]